MTGDRSAESMLPLVYEELRVAAARLMKHERRGHTLQHTALVHEAYAKLAKSGAKFENELHFFNAAAQAMRRILIDYAAAHSAEKRGGGAARVDLDGLEIATTRPSDMMDWPALDAALQRLEKFAPRRAQIVMLKYFAGLGEAEVAKLLGISESSVRHQAATARAWLYQQLNSEVDREQP